MKPLSKSRLMASRQCAKRLWLEINKPDEKLDSASTQASFRIGHQVGDIARKLYDPQGKGELIDNPYQIGFDVAFARTQELMKDARPIFEAGFSAAGALAFADVMLPLDSPAGKTWKMVEVKSSTSVKDYHHDDVAIQAFVANAAKIPLKQLVLSHVDSSWVYPGNNNYQGLLIENDLTNEAFSRRDEVIGWIADAQKIASDTNEPDICTGTQCYSPYECGFINYCESKEPQAEIPYSWIPRIQKKNLKQFIADNNILEMKDIPDDLLNEKQLLVKQHTLANKVYVNKDAASSQLKAHGVPAYFLDFETIQFAVPIWAGTRPYQMIPFQFSIHYLADNNELKSEGFLDLSGNDPSLGFAEKLISACATQGPIYAYNASFEKTRISELAKKFSHLEPQLLAINARIIDLLPIVGEHYYHPVQKGSWSIKAVLPTIAPDLSYDTLDGVQDGSMAMEKYLEAIQPETPPDIKEKIKNNLIEYCDRDTFAMVKIWQFFMS